jgi:molecular chaperone DnaK
MPVIIGVDLGTTNTAVAVLENGRPRVIEDDRGYKVLPSVVSAKGEGRFVVGQAAHNLILTRPDRTVYATKRLIGRRFDSPEVQRVRERVGYQMQAAPDGGVQVLVGDTWMSPQEVAAVVLQVARGIAEKGLGKPVDEAVITVPAHFNHAQRKATLEAAEIAGLRCERLLNEPTAAALAYGHRKNVERRLLVFDLGGGTFDVSVLRLSGGVYEILATNGDTFLGGEDFDNRLVDHLADQFRTRTGVDLRKDRAALQRVKDAAERAKCELSFSDRANVVVAHVAPGQNLEAVVTRNQLDQLTGDLVERCLGVARDAVKEAGLSTSEIDEVILVGGQTRMPKLRDAVAGLFGREPSRTVHPEEAVAVGAAVHGASLGDVEGPAAVLLDVTPFDLGIDSAGGLFSKIVERNSRVPCAETRTFATVRDEQTAVRICVRQGESRIAEENEILGEFSFEGLTPAPRMQTKVAVTFRIDANGVLGVSAVEVGSGEKRNITIRNFTGADRTVVIPDAPPPPGAAVGAATQPSAPVKKKKGFFESIFGARPTITPKPAAPAAAPAAASAVAPATPPSEPGALSAEQAAAALAPPPSIELLPPPTPAPVELTGDLVEVEPDGAFEMPEEVAVSEEDLYGGPSAGPASFGLAGAHQVGTGAAGADPFADLGGGPAKSDPRDPFSTPPGTTSISEADLAELGGLDANDLFAAALGEEDGDPPTNPGLRAAPVPTSPPPQARPAPGASPEPSGLLFESLLDGLDPFPDAAGAPPGGDSDPGDDDFGEIDFSFADAPGGAQGAGSSATPPPPLDDESSFTFPMPDDEPAPAPAPRKPARVKLSYRDRAQLVAEYTDNLRRGVATIRTERPLATGRACVFEISGPGLSTPLVIPAHVTRSLPDGMEVAYDVDDTARRALLEALGG